MSLTLVSDGPVGRRSRVPDYCSADRGRTILGLATRPWTRAPWDTATLRLDYMIEGLYEQGVPGFFVLRCCGLLFIANLAMGHTKDTPGTMKLGLLLIERHRFSLL